MQLFGQGECAVFLVEQEAYEGVKRIAKKVAEDVRLVSGYRPVIAPEPTQKMRDVVLFATVGKSRLLERLGACKELDVGMVAGKREVYAIRLIHISRTIQQQIAELGNVEHLLVIYGSDKRGTIYGMFHLSELMGVSPLYFWGDATPAKRREMRMDESVEMVSKEPSVRYRGFFINDEWPCFGNWTFHHYNGFTAEMYDKVFELLLRLKGNYLWPAMWTSSFALDGPGEESARLADIYGVIMGNSHHEPCLRASEEWDIYRGENSRYGNAWNYVTNKEGLLHYWEDGLKRSGKYENIITVGMRGERDSVMEGPKCLADNIAVLKDIITRQKHMIDEIVNCDGRHTPMLLAIYKEVETYFYGDATTPGLKEWEGLEDVILMFCEDNFGHMRYLPEKGKKHPGGYGMYYHLDYHGDPVSYEWINSTPLTAIWEQMTLAYEHGIRELWMVNVGDLKGNEFPLSYFMELAYDYETWGSGCVNGTLRYTEKWMQIQLQDWVSEQQCRKLAEILTKGIALIGRRRPEALSSRTYHPCNEREADRVLEEVEHLLTQLQEMKETLPDGCMPVFYSMIYDDLQMGLNVIAMQIYAGKNEHYAHQGKIIANVYEKKVRECIVRDREIIAEAALRCDGKWYGMKSGSHIGFRKWNEDGCRYPLTMHVEPFCRPRMLVSRADDERILQKNYGVYDTMEIRDFTYAGTKTVGIEIANDGNGSFEVTIEATPCEWLEIEMENRQVKEQEMLYLRCKKEFLPKELEVCKVLISDGDATVELDVYGRATVTEKFPNGTFLERAGVISILAEHYAKAECLWEDGSKMRRAGEEDVVVLRDFGLCGSGVKNMTGLCEGAESVNVGFTYYVFAEQEGRYQMELWSAPSNPILAEEQYCYRIRNADIDLKWETPDVLPEGYQAGMAGCEAWSRGVIEQVHKTVTEISLKKGINRIEVAWSTYNLVLEKILIYCSDIQIKPSCMGPSESYFVGSE